MNNKREEVTLRLIKTIIGSFIASYILAYIPFGLVKFVLFTIIFMTTWFVADFIYKLLKGCIGKYK